MERQLVEHLVNNDFVSRQEMQRSILRASMRKTSVIEQLLEDEHIDESRLAQLVADYYGYVYLDSVNIDAQPYALKLISGELAEKHGVLPYKVDAAREQVTLAVFDPTLATEVVDILRAATGKEPEIVITARGRLQREIYRHYRGTNDDATPPAVFQVAGGRQAEETLGRHVMETRELSAISPEMLEERSPPPIPEIVKQRSKSNHFGYNVDDKQLSGVLSLSPAAGVLKRTPSISDARVFNDLQDSGGPTRAVSDAMGFQFTSEAVDFAGALDSFDASLKESAPLAFDSGFGPGSDLDHRTGNNIQALTNARLPFTDSESDSRIYASRSGKQADEFDLFDEPKKEESVLTLQQIVEQSHQKIRKLEREVEHQRAVLQTLADLLVEARVISRKQLKDRLKALRKTE